MFILLAGMWMFYNVTKMMFFGDDRKSLKDILKNPVLVAWYLLLPPNMVMSFVYFLEHGRQLIQNIESTAGPLCTFVAFWAISAVVSLNGSSITIAFVTFRLVKRGKKPELKIILIGNAIAWLVGLALATVFLTGNSIGPYQGLYCCVKEEQYYGYRVALIFTTFVVSISTQSAFYILSFLEIKKTEGGGLQSSGGSAKKASSVIMKRGLEMVGVFYLCWFVIAVNSFIAYSGSHPNVWSGCIGAWLAKMNPLLHCTMMYRNLKRIKKISLTNAASSAIGSSVGDEDSEAFVKNRVEELHAMTESLEGAVKKLGGSQAAVSVSVEGIKNDMTLQFAGLRKALQGLEEKLESGVPAPASAAALSPVRVKADTDLRQQVLMLQEQNRSLEQRLVQAYKMAQGRSPAPTDAEEA